MQAIDFKSLKRRELAGWEEKPSAGTGIFNIAALYNRTGCGNI
jgi:hypothetical protein